MRVPIVALLVLLLVSLSVSHAAAVQYQIHDLGILAGDASLATSINNLGQVVVDSATGVPSQASIWDMNSGSQTSTGVAWNTLKINNVGQMAGGCQEGRYSHSYYRDQDGTIMDINPLGDSANGTSVAGINNLGQVVGSCSTESSPDQVYIWDADNGTQYIGDLGGNYTHAEAINDLGQVVGSSAAADGKYNGFIWDKVQGMRQLPFSFGLAVNNSGEVVGYDTTADGKDRPCYWSDAGGLEYLPLLEGCSSGIAMGINELGQVVGACGASGSPSRAFIWDRVNGIQELDGLGFWGASAMAINDLGWVCGTSEGADYRMNAVVWTPVPEPASVLAVLFGMAGLVWKKRRG